MPHPNPQPTPGSEAECLGPSALLSQALFMPPPHTTLIPIEPPTHLALLFLQPQLLHCGLVKLAQLQQALHSMPPKHTAQQE